MEEQGSEEEIIDAELTTGTINTRNSYTVISQL